MTIFEEVKDNEDYECLRLYAMTAARVGRWREALQSARQVLDLTGTRSKKGDVA